MYCLLDDRFRSRRRGAFLLKALLVLLAISGILAVAVPRYVEAQHTGRELAVKSFLRTIVAVNRKYRERYQTYAASLERLAEESKIQAVLESPTRAKYVVTYRAGKHAWSLKADPEIEGTAHFFADQSGVIRFRADAPAGPDDTKVE